MDQEKLQQLAKKGWTSTTVEDFLGLTPEESAYIELKLLLSQSLKEHRLAANVKCHSLNCKLVAG